MNLRILTYMCQLITKCSTMIQEQEPCFSTWDTMEKLCLCYLLGLIYDTIKNSLETPAKQRGEWKRNLKVQERDKIAAGTWLSMLWVIRMHKFIAFVCVKATKPVFPNKVTRKLPSRGMVRHYAGNQHTIKIRPHYIWEGVERWFVPSNRYHIWSF